MDEDKKEEQKKANVDRSKLEGDIKAQKDLASKVRLLHSVIWQKLWHLICSVDLHLAIITQLHATIVVMRDAWRCRANTVSQWRAC